VCCRGGREGFFSWDEIIENGARIAPSFDTHLRGCGRPGVIVMAALSQI